MKDVKFAVYAAGGTNSECPMCHRNGAAGCSQYLVVPKVSEKRSSRAAFYVALAGTTVTLLLCLLFGAALGVSLRWFLYGLVALSLCK